MTEPENLVLALLRELRSDLSGVRSDVAEIRSTMATKSDLAELRQETRADLRFEINSLRADVASDMVLMEKRLGDRIAHLNRAVMEHHSSVIGHGVLYTEIGQRVRRIETHLNLTPAESH